MLITQFFARFLALELELPKAGNPNWRDQGSASPSVRQKKRLEAEIEERKRSDGEIEKKLKTTTVGGVALQLNGVFYLLVGIMFTSIPDGVAFIYKSSAHDEFILLGPGRILAQP
jgi:hypothetical protein